MRKLICLLALLGPATAALAQQAVPRYLMLVREAQLATAGGRSYASLTVIGPDGSIKTEEFAVDFDGASKATVRASITRPLADSTTWLVRRSRYALNKIYQAEAGKLNELGSQGWVLVNTLQEGSTVRYLLRRDDAGRR